MRIIVFFQSDEFNYESDSSALRAYNHILKPDLIDFPTVVYFLLDNVFEGNGCGSSKSVCMVTSRLKKSTREFEVVPNVV